MARLMLMVGPCQDGCKEYNRLADGTLICKICKWHKDFRKLGLK